MSMDDDCMRCGAPLLSAREFDEGYCDHCVDALIENSRASAEWREFHGDSIPKAELPHPPKSVRNTLRRSGQ